MQRFKNILFIATPDSDSEVALERAITLANNNQARLTVVEVIDKIPPNIKLPDGAPSPEEFQAKRVMKHQQVLEERGAPWNNNIEIQIKVLIGIPFLEIIYEVLRNGRDLVIKEAESSGLLDRVFGSEDMHLLRKCPCPVWLVKPKSPRAYRRILAAVDADDFYPPEELNTRHRLNLKILEIASSLALSECAELHVVHAWKAIDEGVMRHAFVDLSEEKIALHIEAERQQNRHNLNALMNETVNKLDQNTLEYIKPQTHLLKGYPRKNIPQLAGEIKADIIVMGTVARTGIPGFFMGNTAETILNQIDCSVIAVKPSGFETPVSFEERI
ncbi:MAG: universal stress protein [Gammaproteobacteria bacterium]|nr:universal stress protein [Gammaproteobacteria bacterium]